MDVYRPLFVLVEAIEAEAQRVLVHQVASGESRPLASVVEAMARVFNEPTLYMQRSAASHDTVIGHRCKVCRNVHAIVVDELKLARVPSVAEYVVERVQALLQRPCSDLGLRGE